MTRHLLNALVPEPLAAQLAKLRKAHDVFTRQWLPPHVTIIPPFDAFLTQPERRALQSVPAPFTVTLGEWGTFVRATTSVLYLRAESEALPAVREDIAQRVPTVAPFVPTESDFHVTIVSRVPNDQLDEVRAAVGREAVSGSFTIDRLTLFEWDDEVRRWIIVP